MQPEIDKEVMEQITEFSSKAKTLPIQIVNEALRYWLDNVAPAKLSDLGLEPLTPRFESTVRYG